MSEKTELDVLLEQLDELLGEGAVDISDALEIATCAGLAQRLGASDADLADADAWRKGPGEDLLEELFEEVDVESLVDGVEGVLGEEVEERELEDAVFDFDDLVAAAAWAGRSRLLTKAAAQVADTIRMSPETFSPLAPYGRDLSRLPRVAEAYPLYDYWMALADTDSEA